MAHWWAFLTQCLGNSKSALSPWISTGATRESMVQLRTQQLPRARERRGSHRGEVRYSAQVGSDVGEALLGDPFRDRGILGKLICNVLELTGYGEVRITVSVAQADSANLARPVIRLEAAACGVGIFHPLAATGMTLGRAPDAGSSLRLVPASPKIIAFANPSSSTWRQCSLSAGKGACWCSCAGADALATLSQQR